MLSLILATALSTMPAPAWLEADPMPPPVVTAPTGIIDTIRQAKALIGKGNALADRGKAILDAADRDGKITVDVRLPKVRAVAGPVIVEKPPPLPPLFEPEPEQIHPAKPTVKPATLRHSYRTTAHQRSCAMCLGQHLRNYHSKTSTQLDKIGYRGWVQFHEGLHDKGVVVKPKSGCVGGTCPVPSRRHLFRPWRR